MATLSKLVNEEKQTIVAKYARVDEITKSGTLLNWEPKWLRGELLAFCRREQDLHGLTDFGPQRFSAYLAKRIKRIA
jgi:hypothetical protein